MKKRCIALILALMLLSFAASAETLPLVDEPITLTYFIPFSVAGRFVSAVSYLLCYKEEFIASWKRLASYQPIGSYAFHDYMLGRAQSKFHQFGGIGNHDHDAIEIGSWLETITGRYKNIGEGENKE